MKINSIKLIRRCCAFLTLISLNAISDVSVKRNPADMLAIVKIENKINYEDWDDFKHNLSTLEAEGYKLKLNAVVLDTKGGSATAAMEIGKIIREKKLNTFVGPTSECASACIYLLSGGIIRMAYGRVSVHRTKYLESMPRERLEKAITDIDNRTRDYIQSMGLSSLLTEAILQTPSWAYRNLELSEKRRWGVHGVERMHEAYWFKDVSKAKGIKLDDLEQLFGENLHACNRKAMKFEMTVYECIGKIL